MTLIHSSPDMYDWQCRSSEGWMIYKLSLVRDGWTGLNITLKQQFNIEIKPAQCIMRNVTQVLNIIYTNQYQWLWFWVAPTIHRRAQAHYYMHSLESKWKVDHRHCETSILLFGPSWSLTVTSRSSFLGQQNMIKTKT